MMWLAQVSNTAGPGLPEQLGIFDVMQKGGHVMWPILFCSILGLGVFLERLFYYHRVSLSTSEFLGGILNLLRRQQFIEARERCDEGHGPVSLVVRTAIDKRQLGPMELREVVREVGQMEVPRLEANLSILSTIGYISTLLGLLGTVLGMIETFLQVNRTNFAAPVGDLAGGIWTSLISTAGGLCVAIPCYVAYSFLLSRMNSIVHEMERAGIETIHVLTEPPVKDIIPMPTGQAAEKFRTSSEA